jgi:hypothetical protein
MEVGDAGSLQGRFEGLGVDVRYGPASEREYPRRVLADLAAQHRKGDLV